jgi:putative inorganic carbon (HCO3(-)) transporter
MLRVLWAVSTALALGAAIASGSRGAWLGLGAGLVGATFLLGGKWRIAGAAGMVGGTAVLWRIGFTRFAELLGKGSVVDSLAVRQEIWMRSVWAIQDFPYTGIGIGAFPTVAPQLYPFFSFVANEAIPHAHNLVLQVGMDLGIPGLLAFLLILVQALLAAARATTRASDGWNRYVAAGSFAALLGVLIHGVVDATLWGTRPALLMWWLIATALAAGRSPDSAHRTVA